MEKVWFREKYEQKRQISKGRIFASSFQINMKKIMNAWVTNQVQETFKIFPRNWAV